MIEPNILRLVNGPSPAAPLRRMLKIPYRSIARAVGHIAVLHNEHVIKPDFQEPVGLPYSVQASVYFKPIPTTFLDAHARAVGVPILCPWCPPKLLSKGKRGAIILDHRQEIVTPQPWSSDVTHGHIVYLCSDRIPVERA